ncbi:hypothetical protein M406DRAFT_249985 [Cryphonectria parasitica EP155]|uniref:non-specific serine/threonine protein kinase n=1 Tax=Cryphonectria parasitica (strain ATCC 38755 / EP155) TaxID=660469 RepID=A0A9P5CSH1_CRYP1|nr:uncharacterized protein M406DRAFT_249985 [Cryphonectria parasitica EP155]KAF3768321.1 hypothetical protein M406DRAFT_249985 [Cryphonectria parasitica EP155]
MLCQMLQALDYLTSIRIVHRNIKPENILYVREPGDQCTFQLRDFSLSKRLAAAETVISTYYYAAPELFDSSLSKL